MNMCYVYNCATVVNEFFDFVLIVILLSVCCIVCLFSRSPFVLTAIFQVDLG